MISGKAYIVNLSSKNKVKTMKKIITGTALVLMLAFSNVYAGTGDTSNSINSEAGPQANGFFLQHDGEEGYTGGWK
ncbi:hypothetical protein GCM10007941_10060 [Amphritea balenae]|nr:hypothetical protein GCM10007941_10060 [Amphritea balenae]